MTTDRLSTKKITVKDTDFTLSVFRVSNGCFLAVSEGSEERLGALALSLKRGDKVDTTTLIPARSGLFLNMLAELAANIFSGMAIVSLYTSKEIGSEDMKSLLNELKIFLKEVEGY